MSKNDRKLISILLIFVMILSFITPVISNAATDSIVIADKAIMENLLEYYDYNKDGVLSKGEAKTIYMLYIPEGTKDLTGIDQLESVEQINYEYSGGKILDFSITEKMNIKGLQIRTTNDIDTFDLSFVNKFKKLEVLSLYTSYDSVLKVDFSDITECENLTSIYGSYLKTDLKGIENFTNLESLSISGNYNEKMDVDLINISKLKNLEYLRISNATLKNASEIGKLSLLENIDISGDAGIPDVSFLKNNTKLTSISISNSDVKNISGLENLKNLEYFYMYGTDVSAKDMAKFIKFNDYKAYIGEIFALNEQTEIYGVLTQIDTEKWNVESSNENIVKISLTYDRDMPVGYIKALGIGKASITFTDKTDSTVKRTLNITVTGISANQESGTPLGVTRINDELILKENGELWKLYKTDRKIEKIATDVQKYVYEFVYSEDMMQAFNYTFALKKDGTVEYTFNGIKSTLKDAKDISTTGYLSNDGTYYEVKINGKFEKVTDKVKSVVGSFLIKEDGTYTITNKKISNIKVRACNGDTVIGEDNVLYEFGYDYDGNVTKLNKVLENVKSYNFSSVNDTTYVLTDGKIVNRYGNEVEYYIENTTYFGYPNKYSLDLKNNLYFNGNLLLTDVEYIDYADYNRGCIIVRKDGSVWELTLDGKAELKELEVTKGNVYFEEKLSLETKEVYANGFRQEVLTGFNIKNLKVSEVLSEDNLKDGYTAKVYDKNYEKELIGNAKLYTGAIIEIYNEDGKYVQTYVALVYGDVTGTGNPSSKDALAIIKNKLNKIKIEDELLLEAGRMTEATKKNGSVPSSSDALAIIKMRLGK